MTRLERRVDDMIPNTLTSCKIFWLAGLAMLMGVHLVPASVLANSNVHELQRKTADIDLLKNQLEDRRQQADAVLGQLAIQQSELVNEIKILMKSASVSSLDDVMAHERLAYDITLMQQLLAYTRAFEEKIRFYQSGRDKLTYLQQLVQDDLKMSATLNDYKIDALTTQISLLVNKYLSEAHIIQIDPQHLDDVSKRQVWDFVKPKSK